MLQAHYRAVTDINWHPAEPDILVSTGIDSWVWAWDIRTPKKAVMGKLVHRYIKATGIHFIHRSMCIQW